MFWGKKQTPQPAGRPAVQPPPGPQTAPAGQQPGSAPGGAASSGAAAPPGGAGGFGGFGPMPTNTFRPPATAAAPGGPGGFGPRPGMAGAKGPIGRPGAAPFGAAPSVPHMRPMAVQPAPGAPAGGGAAAVVDSLFAGLSVKEEPAAPAAAAVAAAVAAVPGGPEPVVDGGESSFSFLNDDSGSSTSFDATPAAPAPITPSSNGIHTHAPSPAAVPAPVVVAPPQPPLPTFSAPSAQALQNLGRAEAARVRVDQLLTGFWSTWRALLESQAQLKQEEMRITTTVRTNTAQIKSIEAAQASAIEHEEYDKADALNHDIERLRAEMQQAQARLAGVQADIARRESEKHVNVQRVLQFLTESANELRTLQSAQTNELESFIKKNEHDLSQQETTLGGQFEDVERSLTMFKADLELIANEERQIHQAIADDTAPHVATKAKLVDEQNELQAQLEELRRQVAEKEAQIRRNHEAQESTTQTIASIRTGHERRLVVTEEKRKLLANQNAGILAEEKALETRRAHLDKQIVACTAEEKKLRRNLHGVAEDLAEVEFLQLRFERDEKRRVDTDSRVVEDSKRLAALQNELVEIERAYQNARQQLMTIESTIDGHHKNIAACNAKIPALEAEKNMAVTARDFKKAATASKDIKTYQQSKQDSETALEELKLQVVNNTQTVESADQKKSLVQSEIRRVEDDIDLKRLQALLLEEKRLLKRQEATTNVLTAALDDGEKKTEHMQKELESIDVLLKWTKVEIDDLRRKHQWSESHGSIPFDSPIDDVSPPVVVSHVNDPSVFDLIVKSTRSSLPIKSPAAVSSASFGVPSVSAPVVTAAAPAPAADLFSSAPAVAPVAVAPVAAAPAAAPVVVAPVAAPVPVAPSYTRADLDAAISALDKVKADLVDIEAKMQMAVETEDYEAAAELEDMVSRLTSDVAAEEAKVAKIRQALPAEEVAPTAVVVEVAPAAAGLSLDGLDGLAPAPASSSSAAASSDPFADLGM